MKVSVSTTLSLPADQVWNLVKRSDTLVFITRGLMGFRSCESAFPTHWKQGSVEHMRIVLFGVLPTWKHSIEFKEISNEKMEILTHESGGLISVWNHQMAVESKPDGQSLYSDVVEIRAGVFTPFVWLFANVFYRYRQLRWHLWASRH